MIYSHSGILCNHKNKPCTNACNKNLTYCWAKKTIRNNTFYLIRSPDSGYPGEVAARREQEGLLGCWDYCLIRVLTSCVLSICEKSLTCLLNIHCAFMHAPSCLTLCAPWTVTHQAFPVWKSRYLSKPQMPQHWVHTKLQNIHRSECHASPFLKELSAWHTCLWMFHNFVSTQCTGM